jgi:hypothetical protein
MTEGQYVSILRTLLWPSVPFASNPMSSWRLFFISNPTADKMRIYGRYIGRLRSIRYLWDRFDAYSRTLLLVNRDNNCDSYRANWEKNYSLRFRRFVCHSLASSFDSRKVQSGRIRTRVIFTQTMFFVNCDCEERHLTLTTDGFLWLSRNDAQNAIDAMNRHAYNTCGICLE